MSIFDHLKYSFQFLLQFNCKRMSTHWRHDAREYSVNAFNHECWYEQLIIHKNRFCRYHDIFVYSKTSQRFESIMISRRVFMKPLTNQFFMSNVSWRLRDEFNLRIFALCLLLSCETNFFFRFCSIRSDSIWLFLVARYDSIRILHASTRVKNKRQRAKFIEIEKFFMTFSLNQKE